MLFNSSEFIFLFLPVTLALYFVIGHWGTARGAGIWLTLASLFFYGWWNLWYLVLIIGSIVVNYWVGVGINQARHGKVPFSAKSLLTLGVVLNLGVLGYYKYANFFLENARVLFGVSWGMADIILPLAISFFTFTQIAYLVDAYHGVTEEYDFLYYALFVSFFPHLIAGPIVSYRQLMPQFARASTYLFQPENLAAGVSLFAMGLAKKVLIADALAPGSQMLFDHNGSPTMVAAWVGVLSFTGQLYFDFSAYSDMAIGLAWMFNVRFPLNFNSPYQAVTIVDFWRRWHITLSQFLRDHLYIPLGGNRHGEPLRYFNLMLTMLLGGLWHGAGWTFVIWGGLHGLYLVVCHLWQRLWGKMAWTQTRGFMVASWGLTFLAVMVGWVFFRAHSVTQALSILTGMTGSQGLGLPSYLNTWATHLGIPASVLGTRGNDVSYSVPALWAVLALLVALFAPNADQIFRLAARPVPARDEPTPLPRWRMSRGWAIVTAVLLGLSILSLSSVSEFLYFKF